MNQQLYVIYVNLSYIKTFKILVVFGNPKRLKRGC
jgi:hypothetical protein